MNIKSIFVTRRDTKFCAWCHKPIPRDRQANAKYCCKECAEKGRKAYRQEWYQQKKHIQNKEKAEKRRKIQENRMSFDDARAIVDFVNSPLED